MKRRSLAALFLALAMLFLTACGGGTAQNEPAPDASGEETIEPINLIMGHCDAEDENDPYHQSCIAFAKAVNELSGGLVTVTVYPNAQLGDERSVVEAIQNGSVDCSTVTNAVTSNFQPITKILDYPFMFESVEQAREVTGSAAAQKILDSMSEVGIKGLAFTENGFRYILNNKHPIANADDLSGLKLRVMQSPVYMDFYSRVNCGASPLPFGEVYTAVSQGTVDGYDLPLPVVLSSKLYEISKYMSDIRYTYTSLMIIMNEEKFNSYPAQVQEWLLEAAQMAREACFAKNDEVLANGMAQLEGVVEITPFESVDFAGFQAVSQPVWDNQTESDAARAILDEILELTSK